MRIISTTLICFYILACGETPKYSNDSGYSDTTTFNGAVVQAETENTSSESGLNSTNATEFVSPSPTDSGGDNDELNSSGSSESTPGSDVTPTSTPDQNSNVTQASPEPRAEYTPVADPASFSVTQRTPTSITLQWSAPIFGQLKSFKSAYVEGNEAPESCDTGSIVGSTILGTQTTYSFLGLKAKTRYSFRICSVGAQDESSVGLTLSAKTLELPPEEIVSLLLLQPSFSLAEVQASWVGPVDISNFKISYLRGSVNPPANCNEGNNLTVTENNFKITGLSAGEWIAVRVCSLNNNEPPEMSAGITGTVYVHSPAPSSVSNVRVVSKTTSSVTLGWQASTGMVGSYIVAYSESAFPVSCESGTVKKTSQTSLLISDLRPQTKIYALICAENTDSVPLVSAGSSLEATTDALPIPPVTGLRCPVYPSLNVTWDNSSSDGYYVSISSPAAPLAGCVTNPQIFTTRSQQTIPPFGAYIVKVCSYMAGNPNTISVARQVICVN